MRPRGIGCPTSASISLHADAPRAGEGRLRRFLEAAQVDDEIVGSHRCRGNEGDGRLRLRRAGEAEATEGETPGIERDDPSQTA